MKISANWFLILLILLFYGCSETKTGRVTIATAANMQFAMKELTRTFTQQTGIECQVIMSSSGKLTAQIKEGAPYDVFVSADMKYPEELYRGGYTTGRPGVYAYGKLILWSIDNNIIPSIELLTDPEIKHIALANPKTAPYGVASVEVLQHFGIYNEVEHKLVYGESIAQTNQFITSGAAEIGFTAKSVVLSDGMKGRGNWIEPDGDSYEALAQGAVLLKKNEIKPGAEQFFSFLFSENSVEILVNFGYLALAK